MMETYTLTQIAGRLGKPESTLRGYRDRFSEFIPTVGRGRSRRYPEEAVEVFKLIIGLKDQGYQDAQTYERLTTKYTKTVEVVDTVRQDILDEIRYMREGQALLAKRVMEQAKVITELQERLDQLQEAQAVTDGVADQAAQVAQAAIDRAAELAADLQEVQIWRREKERTDTARPWWMFWKPST